MMRSIALLFVCAVAGCGPLSQCRANRWLNQMNPFSGPGEKVILQTYLLDQPAGDPYLTKELWGAALKPLDADKTALLLENGIRVGHLTGNPPYQFLNLARSDDSVVKPVKLTLPAGETKPIALNGPLPQAKFNVFASIGTKADVFELKDAETAINITATPAENGKVKLVLEPRVQHGGRQLGWKPTFDATGFTWLDQKVQERYPTLKFEVTIAPEEFLLIGPGETPANLLGGACFVAMGDQRARMRVLVVQAANVVNSTAPRAPGAKPSAIAAQAGVPLVRGQRP